MKQFALFICLVAYSAALPTQSTDFLGGRVVGGQNAVPNSAPYMVSLQMAYYPGYPASHDCGGAIINENFILTAAHCISGYSRNRLEIVAGKHNLKLVEKNEQRRLVAKLYIHPLYVEGTDEVGPYDIGIIRVNKPFEFNQFVNKIDLPVANIINTGSATLFGWGDMSNTNSPIYTNILQTLTKPIIDYKVCESIYGGPSVGGPLHSSNLCTGPLSGGADACGGDSGGPLIQNDTTGKPTLIGVVSWGPSPCAQRNSPGVYVRVSAFNSWIEKTIK